MMNKKTDKISKQNIVFNFGAIDGVMNNANFSLPCVSVYIYMYE